MKLKYNSGKEISTESLSDVDCELLEKCQELQDLHQRYHRQLLILTECSASAETKKNRGSTSFYYLTSKDKKVSQEERDNIIGQFVTNISAFVTQFSNGLLEIVKVEPEN